MSNERENEIVIIHDTCSIFFRLEGVGKNSLSTQNRKHWGSELRKNSRFCNSGKNSKVDVPVRNEIG